MPVPPLQDALTQVRRLQEIMLSRRFFQGYSGKARLLSGGTALVGAFVMSRDFMPAAPRAHLLGWMAVLGVALLLNYGALLHWILTNPRVRQRPVILKPALDALPALIAGGALTVALVRGGQFDLLFGVWMCLFGVAHLAYRQSLPGENYLVGLYYLIAGAACLLAPGVRMTQPWPMGLIFFTGELVGGSVLMLLNDRERDLERLQAEEEST